jgi:rhodanese-related sulfurtransferase
MLAAAALATAVGPGTAIAGLANKTDDATWRLDPGDPRTTLDAVERALVLRYRVPDMSATSLEAALAGSAMTIFDVRTRDEYETGHIPGAIRIDPKATAAEFLATHRDLLKERPAVFYCAVGVRYSRMLSRFLREVAPAGAHNLRGGAFRWVAEGRRLVAGAEPGRLHAFDDGWERLLQRTVAAK